MDDKHKTADDMLDELRAGQRSDIEITDIHYADQAAELVHALESAPLVTKVRLPWFSARTHLATIAGALKKCPELRVLEIPGLSLKEEDILTLLPALQNMPKLEVLSLEGAKLSDATMGRLTDIIRNDLPHLKDVVLDDIQTSPQGSVALLESLKDKSDLRIVRLRGCPIRSEGVESLQGVIKDKRHLMGLYVNKTGLDPTALAQLEQTLLETASPNLTHFWADTKSDTLNEFCAHNRTRIKTIAERIDGLNSENPLHPEEIWEYERCKTAAQYLRKELSHENYDRFTSTLPTPPKPPKLEYLLAGNSKGYTALDNPRTWQKHPDLLNMLAENGELTAENLKRCSPKGISLLESAIGFAPRAQEVIQTLNRHGIRLNASTFVDFAGQPTRLMQQLSDRWECGAILQKENWEGQSRASLQAVMKAIPQEQYASMPGRHSFMASLAPERSGARQR